MKKYFLYFVAIVTMVAFVSSCGGGSNSNDPDETEPEKTYSVVGSWESGKYFVTFSSSGYYTAYLGDNFIDSGTYSYSSNRVVCVNNYFNRTTIYSVDNISEKSLKLSAKLHTIDGIYSTDQPNFKDVNKSMVFQKATTSPTEKDNPLIGKYMTINHYTKGTVKWTFLTHCTALMTATRGDAIKYPLSLYYIYYNGILYEQRFCTNNGEAIPSISDWTVYANDGTINAYSINCSLNSITYGDVYNLD